MNKSIRLLLEEFDKLHLWPRFYQFAMTSEERKLFEKIISTSNYYLEFGAGGSTFSVLQNSSATVFSVESSAEWIAGMRQYRMIRSNEKSRLSFEQVAIGPTGNWGFPIVNIFKESFPEYSSSIFRRISAKLIDTVLVDGRFRVACILKVILECHDNDPVKIMVHDFWIRPQYHCVLKFLDVLFQKETLAVFRIKADLDLAMVESYYQQYKYIPD